MIVENKDIQTSRIYDHVEGEDRNVCEDDRLWELIRVEFGIDRGPEFPTIGIWA